MATQKRVNVVILSMVAFIALTISVPIATKDSFLVLYGLHFQVNGQVRHGDESEAIAGLIFAIVFLLAGVLCTVTAVLTVKRHLPSWNLIWPTAGLIGGLAFGLTLGQVNDCLVYLPAEVCGPGGGY